MENKTDRASWLKGPSFTCCPEPTPSGARPWRLILLGPPGVGKGTIAQKLVSQIGACHLSTGDVFRAAKNLPESERSPAISEALDYMKRGELVPDTTVLDLVRERIDCLHCEGGFLLDGFPRTVQQAEALKTLLAEEQIPLDGVFNYHLSLPEIVARLGDRRTCASCKKVYSLSFKPPANPAKCDHCGGDLYLREDDNPETIKVRMETYEKSTAPLIEFYRKEGLLIQVSCSQGSRVAFQETVRILETMPLKG